MYRQYLNIGQPLKSAPDSLQTSYLSFDRNENPHFADTSYRMIYSKSTKQLLEGGY